MIKFLVYDDSFQVYLFLLKMYLCPSDPNYLGLVTPLNISKDVQINEALNMLEKYANKIDTAKVRDSNWSNKTEFLGSFNSTYFALLELETNSDADTNR